MSERSRPPRIFPGRQLQEVLRIDVMKSSAVVAMPIGHCPPPRERQRATLCSCVYCRGCKQQSILLPFGPLF
ncbi:MAG: hypothetical protein RIQ93_2498 [Verrucomicrobiota bacterium]|jgi:hypothetical protein